MMQLELIQPKTSERTTTKENKLEVIERLTEIKDEIVKVMYPHFGLTDIPDLKCSIYLSPNESGFSEPKKDPTKLARIFISKKNNRVSDQDMPHETGHFLHYCSNNRIFEEPIMKLRGLEYAATDAYHITELIAEYSSILYLTLMKKLLGPIRNFGFGEDDYYKPVYRLFNRDGSLLPKIARLNLEEARNEFGDIVEQMRKTKIVLNTK